jgi:AcrR family transcriptional regulator
MLRDGGVDQLFMKTLAARSDLSLATLYSLFGSKQDILIAVANLDMAKFETIVANTPTESPLDRIFVAVDIGVSFYQADPEFYRKVMGGGLLERPAEPAFAHTLHGPTVRFWTKLIADAISAKQLKATINPKVLAPLLNNIFGGVLTEWISSQIDTEQLRARVKFGFAATFSAFVSRQDAGWLSELLSEAMRTLGGAEHPDRALPSP